MSDTSCYCEHDLIQSGCPECTPGAMVKSAILSAHRLYRYVLWRTWDNVKPRVMFIGLNPSTADENDDDPTIRRCVAFAKSWGFGGFAMVNLFGWRCTNPVDLGLQTYDAVGTDNDKYLIETGQQCALVVAAWGNGKIIKAIDPDRPGYVRSLFPTICYLTLNDDGQPGHPLYLKGTLVPKIWE